MPDRTATAPSVDAPVAFIDLAAQRRRLGSRVDDAIARVLEHGQYIMGPEVRELEQQLAAFGGAADAVSCGSGTDALLLPLLAWGVGPGDAVFVPSFTFAATAEVVALVGATPVFVDVLPGTANLDAASLEAAVGACGELRPAAVIPVDLFGLPADPEAVAAVAARHGLRVLSDAAQSFGATWGGRRVGTFGDVTATSFFPAKPLGCYGDGGAILTDDAELAAVMRSVRVHGQGSHKYENVRVGTNARLDTLQAAILLEKLDIFPDELQARDRVAGRYTEALSGSVTVLDVSPGATSAWAQYTVRVPNRDDVAARLKADGIPTAIYYPVPLHRQPAYDGFPVAPGGLPVSELLASEVLSLPMHPYLDEPTQDRIVDAVRRAVA